MGKYASRDKPKLVDAVELDDTSITELTNKLDVTKIIKSYLETNGITITNIRNEIDAKIAKAIKP